MNQPPSHDLHAQRPSHGAQTSQVTRLAPSPTGSLHLGNAFAFVTNWALARKLGWRVVLRIEDLDASRVQPGMTQQAIDTLAWLGLDWDNGPIIQSERLTHYQDAMQTLARDSRVYPCELSRREIEQALSAPHDPQHEDAPDTRIRPDRFPDSFHDAGTSWRFVSDDPGGDFIVWTKRGAPSYQLAVVVDDHRSGITQVVRGRDLLESTPRQRQLYRSLGYAPEPSYTHLPLVKGPDARRLAKRDRDTHIASYSALGGPERVLGLIAQWCGMLGQREPITISGFLDAFEPDTLPADDLVFSQEDARWLSS